MKNILLFGLLFTGLISCNNLGNQYGLILSEDEKSNLLKSHLEAYMNNDPSVAETLFAEDLLLYDQFANNQTERKTNPNPGGKQGLIEADKFTHSLFSDIKLTTNNIKTYELSNGKVYTAFWSMWSGQGNFTGEKMTLPFYCLSLWEGNQIAKIWRYMDPSGLNNELTALEGANKSSTKVVGIGELAVNRGFSIEEVDEFLVGFTKFIRDTEPGTYDFSYFISSNGKSVNLIEKYFTSDDFVHHLNNFEKSDISKDFLKIFSIKKVIIAGNASEELIAKGKGYGAEFRKQIGGWID